MWILLEEFYSSKKQHKLRFLLDHGCKNSIQFREKKASKYLRVPIKNSLDLTLIYSQGFLLSKMHELSSS